MNSADARLAYSVDALAGATLVIIGGTSGIGLAVAEAAQDAGASRVIVTGRSQERLHKALQRLGENATGTTLDGTDDRAVEAFFADMPIVHHVLVTVGEAVLGTAFDRAYEDVRQTLDAKVRAAYLAAKFAGPQLAESRMGGADASLTFVSGLAAWRPFEGAALAAAANASVEAMARVFALELRPARVNAIVPGVISTPLLDRVFGDTQSRASAEAEVARSLPIGRIGTPSDIAHAALFLMTNSFVTGSTLHVDGGALLV